MNKLAGKVAVVTGAARGIGAATALELARQGAHVVAGVRKLESVGPLKAELAAVAATSHTVECDVADYKSVERMIDTSLDRFGRVDFVVNNAGQIDPIGRMTDTDPAAWAKAIQVNLVGCYNVAHAAVPYMLRQGGGCIVNISTGAAHTPREGWTAYCSSKAGLAMLTRAIAHEYAAQNIRVYGFAPGVVDTEMQVKIRASGINEISRLKREQLGAADKPARVIAYLCSDAAADLAGHELSIADEKLKIRAGIA